MRNLDGYFLPALNRRSWLEITVYNPHITLQHKHGANVANSLGVELRVATKEEILNISQDPKPQDVQV